MTRPKSPYVVPVHDLMHRPGEVRRFVARCDAPATLGEGMARVGEGSPIENDLTLESAGEGILARGTVHATVSGECSRCVGPFEQPLQVEFCELFAYSSDGAYEYEVHNDSLDLEQVVRDAVVLSLPFSPLCREDCYGLDPATGERFENPPELASATTVDPRWAALTNFCAETQR